MTDRLIRITTALAVVAVATTALESHEYGSTGWGDAATVVPWALYEAYADADVLRRQYPSMRAWVDWCAGRRREDGTWSGDWHFGAWLDLGVPPDEPEKATTARAPRMGSLMDGPKREAYLYSYCGQSFPRLSRASGGMRPWIAPAHEGGHLPVRTVTVLHADRTGCHHGGDPAGRAQRGFGGDPCGSGPQRP